VAASIFAAISFAVCFFGFALPVMAQNYTNPSSTKTSPSCACSLSLSLCTASAATAVGFTQLWITRKTSNFGNRLQEARRCSSPTKFRPSLAKSNQIPQSNTFSQRSMHTQQQPKERRKHN
jgi:hypothetical protein